jgi:hypothetical protein
MPDAFGLARLLPAATFARAVAAFLFLLPVPTVFPVRCCCSYARDALSCYEAISSYLLEKLEVPVLSSGTKKSVRQSKGLE